MTKAGLRDVLNYCIPAGRVSGVRIGVHWTFPFAFLVYTMQANAAAGGDWALVVGTAFLLLYGIILAHEFGHVFAARREGIGTDRVMLWPLGGLAFLGEEATGHAEVRIAAAGPAVNVFFALLLFPVLLVVGIRPGFGLLNPLSWGPIDTGANAPGFAQELAFTVFKLNLIVLLFNLIPAFPMDGGRILRGMLHPRHGALKSIYIATSISFVACAGIVVWGLAAGSLLLVLIGVFTAVGAIQTRRQVRMMAAEMEQDRRPFGYDFSMGHTSLERSAKDEGAREEERRRKEREQERKQAEEDRRIEEGVDLLLDKISSDGIDSLSRKERAFLEKASRRRP